MTKLPISFEEIVQLSIKDSATVQPPASLIERVIFAIERKKRFYAFIKLAVYSAVAVVSSVGCAIIWRAEGASILNSEAVKLFTLFFTDFSIITTYWQEYIISLSESLPVVSIITVAVFAWIACASLWMAARTYTTSFRHAVKHI